LERTTAAVLAVLLLGLVPATPVAAAPGVDFIDQPGGGQPGVAWSQQPTVAIRTGNNIVESATGSITLSIVAGTGTGNAVLTCSALTVTLVDGVASFSGCRIDLAGNGYRLRANWSEGGTTDSNPFTVSTGGGATGTKLGFVTQPARGTPNVALASQPRVAVQHASGATVTGVAPTVIILALGANPGGATLTCTGGLAATTSNGVATFTGCRLDKVGVGYAMVATASGLTSATSAQFDVADRLAFAIQPAGAAAGVAFTSQPVVAVRSGPNATATHDSATVIALAIKAGTGATGAVLTCTGGLTKIVSAGMATFSGCAIDRASPTSPANPYVLVATATGLTNAESTTLPVAARATLSIETSAAVITWGSQIVLTVRLDQLGSNRTIQIQGSRDGSTWANIAPVVTNAAGVATRFYSPVTNLYYRAVFGGAPDLAALTSGTTRTVVRQISLLRSINRGFVVSLNAGTNVTFTDTVRPARPELPPATVRFVFYRRGGDGVWRLYDQRDVVINSLGIAATTWNFPVTGEWYVRSQARPTSYNANSVWGGLQRFSIR
jgi:hypothetical protein